MEFDIVGGGVERVLRLGNSVDRSIFCRDSAVHLLTPLIEQFDGGEALGYESAGAI